MADSPSDPPSDDPAGSFADEAELLEFLETTLRRLGRSGLPAGATAAGGGEATGSGWRVEERDDGTFAVLSDVSGEVAGTFRQRERAYLVAATLTVGGTEVGGSEGEPPVDEVAEPPGDLGEGWPADPLEDPMERRKELSARTLRGLLSNPGALELFLRSVDPEVLREAMAIRQADLDDPDGDAN